jgi:hypothetical protein
MPHALAWFWVHLLVFFSVPPLPGRSRVPWRLSPLSTLLWLDSAHILP